MLPLAHAFLIATCLALMNLNPAQAAELQRPAPGKKIKVFLFAGQSNMEGRADARLLTAEDRERLRRVQDRIQFAYNRQPIAPLDVAETVPDIRELYKIEKSFGPELSFGMAMAEAWPEERFLFIKRSVGGTSLYGAWNPEWTAEKAQAMEEELTFSLFADFQQYVREVLSGYAPEDYELCAMLWVQGEGDRKLDATANSYAENLNNLIARVRKQTGAERLPFLLFDVGNEIVSREMHEVDAADENVVLLPQSQVAGSADFYTKIPNGHYDHGGLIKLGERFAEAYLMLRGNR